MRSWKLALLAGCVALFAALPALDLVAQSKDEKKGSDRGKKQEGSPEKKPRSADKPAKAPGRQYDLSTRGVLGAQPKSGGEFYELSYQIVEGKKAVKKKAWVKIDAETVLLRDRAAGVAEFKEGESLMIFGKPVERESAGPGGISAGKNFRLIQASRVIIGGKGVSVNEKYADPKDKDFDWCEATVEKAGPAMTVTYEGASYKLDIDRKGSAILIRGDGDLKRDVKRGAQVVVSASALSEGPGGEEKDERPAYKAEQVIIIEPRLLRWYEALLQK